MKLFLRLNIVISLSIFSIIDPKARADERNWVRVLTCDSGSAYLEVASDERRLIQFVITDANITKYLADNSFLQPVFNNPNIMVITGAVDNGKGIFTGQDFTSGGMSRFVEGYVDTAQVDREGNGIYVHFYRKDYHSGYGNDYIYPGNWHFRNCQ